MASPIQNTLTVWHALFLREALDRFFGSRAGWAWLVIEPTIHLLLIGYIFSIIRGALKGNVDVYIWICIGMLAFFLFRRTAVQVQHAVDCNKAFFAFRQVRPFDAALARGSVEAFSMFFVSLLILIPLGFFGKQVIPRDPLLLLICMAALWFMGIGYGMITSTLQRLVPETGHIFTILFFPLYFLSGVLFPLDSVPEPYRGWLLYNPLSHALELVRYSFFNRYPLIKGASLSYVFYWVLILAIIGLILYKLFEKQLIRR